MFEFDETVIEQVRVEELDALRERLAAEGCTVLELRTAMRTGKEGLFSAIRELLPLDPRLESTTKWEGLSDSLWGGLHGLESPHIALVWSDAHAFSFADPSVYAMFIDVLGEIAGTLREPRFTAERPTDLRVFLTNGDS